MQTMTLMEQLNVSHYFTPLYRANPKSSVQSEHVIPYMRK